jgi:hypothetical protein
LPVQDYEKEKELSDARDAFIERFTIEEVLKLLLKEIPYIINSAGNIEIIYNHNSIQLPKAYGFKGGVARSILRESLGLKVVPPRDVDIIRLDPEPYDGSDDDVAKEYMSQDFEFGDGVEFVEDSDSYLSTRDFTINEVYVHGSKIIATEQCVKDTIRNIIRITEREKTLYSGDGIGPKMKAKILRFHAEQMHAIGVSSIPEDISNEIERSFINPFWLCVQLDRAFERGVAVADKFTSLLIDNKIIPDDIKSGTDLGDYLLSKVYDFRFRNAPHLQYNIEESSHVDDEDQRGLSESDLLERYFDTVCYGSKF